MRLVLLTNKGSHYGRLIVNEFNDNNIYFNAVILIKQPLTYYWRLFSYVRKKNGFINTLLLSVKRILRGFSKTVKRKDSGSYTETISEKPSDKVFYTKGTNTEQTVRILKSLNPDIIVLGQTGIIRKQILNIPEFGILNGHPGILPRYRGMDCSKWAILEGKPSMAGSTVHWVDKGVDTGPILLKEKYRLSRNDNVNVLDDRLYEQCAKLLARFIAEIDPENPPEGEKQQISDGRQYYKMNLRQESLVNKEILKSFDKRECSDC